MSRLSVDLKRELRERDAHDTLIAEGWDTYVVYPGWVRAERGKLKVANSSWHALLLYLRRGEELREERRTAKLEAKAA